MKMLNDMELDQVNGGVTLGQFFDKVKDFFDTAGDLYDAITRDEKDITVTENEDGTVTASGGW